MTMDDIARVAEGYNPKYIGIGKIMLEADGAEYNIPHLHFLISDDGNGRFSAVNLEFGVVSAGDSVGEASDCLAEMMVEYVKRSIDLFGYDCLIENARKDSFSEQWCVYRGMEFSFGKNKNDLSHKFVEKIENAIREELMEKYGFSTDYNYSVFDKAAA